MTDPRQGEVWWVNFDPTVGAEIRKRRTAVVVSQDGIGRLPLRIVVPITGWDDRFANYPWVVRLKHSAANGLSKESAADTFQVKSVSIERCTGLLGRLSPEKMEEIRAAIQICIGAI
jgi:mRNA interferase MazF